MGESETGNIKSKYWSKTIQGFVERHAALLITITLFSPAIVGAYQGYTSTQFSSEDYRWKLEPYLQSSLVFVGLLIIFASNFNRWASNKTNWERAAKILRKDVSDLRDMAAWK